MASTRILVHDVTDVTIGAAREVGVRTWTRTVSIVQAGGSVINVELFSESADVEEIVIRNTPR